MLAELKREFDEAYFEWQLSEAMLDDVDDPVIGDARECIERCTIREYQECETIAKIAKRFFNVTFMEIFD